jgi:hypothetical protein
MALVCVVASHAQARDSAAVNEESPRTLFVYDTLDKDSRFFIQAFRDAFADAGIAFDEAAVEHATVDEMSPYERVIIYSRVMAFNMKSAVRTWVKTMESFKDTKVLICVTAHKWFEEKHRKGLAAQVKKKDGELVDAVAKATAKMSEKEKRAWVRQCLSVFNTPLN